MTRLKSKAVKLFKVDYFVYTLANSLLPPRDPTPEEEVPWEEASYDSEIRALIDALIWAGYSREMATYVVHQQFAFFWYVCGIRDIHYCLQATRDWMRDFLNPVIVQVDRGTEWHVPPAVIYFAVVLGIVIAVAIIVAPEWEEVTIWRPPCNLYLGTYGDEMWWMTLAGVSAEQVPYYKALVYQGSCIAAHTYEYIAPPVVTDRLHFWGTLEWRCWQIPWFRVYRTQYADCIFVGFLQHTGAGLYRLREPFYDHWAPRGPIVIPEAEYCTTFSPCG